MNDLTNAVDRTKPEPLDLDEIRIWADYAKREKKEMGMEPDAAIALLDRLQQAERDRDHYYLAAEIEAREVDRQKAIAVAAVAKLLPALSACLKAMRHALPYAQRGFETGLLERAIKAAEEAMAGAVDPEPTEGGTPDAPSVRAPIEWKQYGLQQVAPNGSLVGVIESRDGDAYLVKLLTPARDPESVTTFAIADGTLATLLILIAKQGGLWIPGVGIVRVTQGAPVLATDADAAKENENDRA